MHNKNTKHISRAKNIQHMLGTWVAARFLAKRGWSLEAALWILLGRTGSRA